MSRQTDVHTGRQTDRQTDSFLQLCVPHSGIQRPPKSPLTTYPSVSSFLRRFVAFTKPALHHFQPLTAHRLANCPLKLSALLGVHLRQRYISYVLIKATRGLSVPTRRSISDHQGRVSY